MAHREHVIGAAYRTLALAAFAALLISGCSEAGPPATEFRGRVIDQDTDQPIAGAIVVGKYIGSRGLKDQRPAIASKAPSRIRTDGSLCRWIARDGGPLMEAYHHGYKWGRSPEGLCGAVDGNIEHWQVQIVEWDAEINRARLIRYEPTIYRSAGEALAASRQEIDVYLKPFSGTREERLRELHRLHVAGKLRSASPNDRGPVPFFEALFKEETELGDDKRSLDISQEYIHEAEGSFARARGTK